MKIAPTNIFKVLFSTALKIGIALLILRGLEACKHEPIVPTIEPPPIVVETPDPCGLKTLTYTKNIEPMMTTYCVSSVCHGSRSAPRGIELNSHRSLSQFIQSDSARFFGSIRQDGFYSQMPWDRPISKLDSCSIKKLETWVKQGMPNN